MDIVGKYEELKDRHYYRKLGKVTKVVGLTVESVGPDAALSDLCLISTADNSSKIMAEVVGFRDKRLILMPFYDMTGVGVGCIVENPFLFQ